MALSKWPLKGWIFCTQGAKNETPPETLKFKVREVSQIGFWNISWQPTSVPSFSQIGWPQLLAPGTLSQTMTLKLFCRLRKKLFSVLAISTLFEIVPSLSTRCWRPQLWLSLPDRNLIKFQSFRKSCLFSETLLLKQAWFVCLIKLVTWSVLLFLALVRSLSHALIHLAMLSLTIGAGFSTSLACV